MNDNVIEGLARVEIEELDDTCFHERYEAEFYAEKELHSDSDLL